MTERHARIHDDVAALEKLASASTIFRFEPLADPPERLKLSFRGVGLQTDRSTGEPEHLGQHEIELRLPYGYPDYPPDVRWLTPIFHPNVSFSGFVNLSDLGIEWSPDVGLDVVCEQLWDALRLARFNLDRAVSQTAKKWIAEQPAGVLPVDPRPLRDRAATVNRNVIAYRWRNQPPPAAADDVLYIGEEPTTPLPPARGRPAAASEGDVIYIE
jgi:ubiquitin-protein ligase